jgi:hypothetical protein
MNAEEIRDSIKAAVDAGLPVLNSRGDVLSYRPRRKGDHKPWLLVTSGGRLMRYRYSDLRIGQPVQDEIVFVEPEEDTVPVPREVYDAMLTVARHFMKELG